MRMAKTEEKKNTYKPQPEMLRDTSYDHYCLLDKLIDKKAISDLF